MMPHICGSENGVVLLCSVAGAAKRRKILRREIVYILRAFSERQAASVVADAAMRREIGYFLRIFATKTIF